MQIQFIERTFRRIAFLVCTIFMNIVWGTAQTPSPPPPLKPRAGGPGTEAPIDDYIVWMVFLAVALMVYFIRMKNKRTPEQV